MKYFMILLSASSFMLASDYQQSAKEKERRYAIFIRVMNLLAEESEPTSAIAQRRQFLVSNIYVKPTVEFIRISEEDNDENEWKLLSAEDFEPVIATGIRE